MIQKIPTRIAELSNSADTTKSEKTVDNLERDKETTKNENSTMINRQQITILCLALLGFSIEGAFASHLQEILYSTHLCKGPGKFCPEPDCLHPKKKPSLCKYYTCETSESSDGSSRFLKKKKKKVTGTCTNHFSVAACGSDKKCLDACKKLNGGSCPACLSYEGEGEEQECVDGVSDETYEDEEEEEEDVEQEQQEAEYEGDENQESYSYSVSNGSGTTAASVGPGSSTSMGFYFLIAGIVISGVILAAVWKKKKSPRLLDELYPSKDGLVATRLEAVESGRRFPGDISQREHRTKSHYVNMML